MINLAKKFNKVVILDTVIFYPEHRKLLNSISREVIEYPSSLPASLEKDYENNPGVFTGKKCYTEIATDNIPLQLLMSRVEGADVIISCWTNIPDEILKLNPQLKLVIFWTHEKEHRINTLLAKKLGIEVTNIPDYGTESVSEVVFAGLFSLITRNFPTTFTSTKNQEEVSHTIINHLFGFFRKLSSNEKNTRRGKFVHHFHKIGQVKFDFSERNMEDLIPEKLLQNRKVGFLNMQGLNVTIERLTALGVICEQYQLTESTLASYFKFLTDNEIIFYEAKNINLFDLNKSQILFGDKLVDVSNLVSSTYSFNGKTFGIVGLGRIGFLVAKIATGMGFKVIYYSKTRKVDLEKTLGIKYSTLEKMSEIADIISINLPAHHAENTLNEKLILKMKPGVIVINTADGNAIDQQALTSQMINNNILAFLDVYPGLPRKDILGLPIRDKTDWKISHELSNHILTYRAGWKTQESIRVKTYKLLGNMVDYLLKNNI
ncbi:MAG: hypothetical protein A2589_00525 [Candidatus Vogelbacteria bacterium RIFOXYD1_FULL_46_19]|uniref:D-isomer specific 2-hydroxyacid dehydrogenase NAD-binding domain-containing protein n=1 Tax=Candidatus Vogelbacteria bacterium RIFOXYD1_FULL_46_19 TaxID=1802439 RepID=A0A1G2QHT5_9BACT|nr:MAG: hypothetical protein A2589_00525 [Candidatus Vogelbacteria bacterium RIFOXYD1_FULL_46_19]